MKKQLQRVLALFIVLTMLLSTVAFTAPVEAFSDFPDGWSAEAMTAAVENGLLKGDANGLVLPKANLTRAQMATIVVRAFGATVEENIEGKYVDVAKSDWFYSDIAKAVNMQTFSGVNENEMNPNSDITRQEVMVVIARALLLEDAGDVSVLDSFTDKADVAAWAKASVAALVERGYVNGYSDSTLKPKNTITREEFAQILHNIFGTYIAEAGTYTSVVEAKSVMINAPGVTLSDVTIDGDLVIGDGVGDGEIVIDNVKVNGRIVVRGGHGKITFKSTTCTDNIYVKDVNGTVYFYNYDTEALFEGMVAKTPVKFREKIGGSVGGGTGSVTPPAAQTAKYVVKTLMQNLEDDNYTVVKVEEKIGNVGASVTIAYPAITPEGFHQSSSSILTGTITKNTELELEICYDRNEYDVTFVGADPANKVTETLRYGAYYPFPASLEQAEAGYVFGGWYTEANGQGTKVLSTDKVGAGLSLYAHFIPLENIVYSVQHAVEQLDGSYAVVDVEYYFDGKTGESVTATPASFEHFTYDASISTVSGVVLGDGTLALNLYYKRDSYTIVFDVEGVTTSQTVKYEEAYTIPADPAKLGYTFYGWCTEPDGNGMYTVAGDGAMKDSTFYAIFYPNYDTQYKIEVYFQNIDGTYNTVADEEAYYEAQTDSSITILVEPDAAEGFTFDAGSSIATGVVVADGSLVLKIYFTRNIYDITFNVEGVTTIVPTYYEDEYPFPADPVKEGYTFDGWCTEADGTGTYIGEYDTVSKAQTLYAIFYPNYDTQYKVEHYLQNLDGTYNTVADEEEIYEAETASTVTVTENTYEGFTFDASSSIVSGTVAADGSLVLKLYYTRNTDTPYTVEHYLQTVNGFGFDFFEAETLYGMTGATVSATPKTYEGFEYDTTGYAIGEIAPDGSLVIKLYYARVAYSVVFNVGNVSIPAGALYGQNYPLPANDPTPEAGYIFTGWYTEANGQGTKILASDTLSGSVTTINLYANFIAEDDISYKVEHYQMDLDGNYTILIETDYAVDGVTGETVTALPKTYVGFTYNASISTVSGVITPDGSLVLTLYYDRNVYDIVFDVDGVTTTVPTYYGAVYPFPADPVKAGYTFDGWFTEAVGGTMISATEKVSGAKTLYAHFTANDDIAYTIEHYLQNLDGTYTTAYETENKFGTVDTTVTATEKTYEGFTFDASSSVVSGTVAADGSLVLTLYYTRNIYDIVFDVDGVTTTVPTYYGDVYPFPADPAKLGYTFDGWFTEAVGGTKLSATDTVSEATTIYAQFIQDGTVAYTVEHYLQNLDGTYTNAEEIETKYELAGTSVTATEKTYEGFTFDASSSVVSGTVAEDGSLVLTLYYTRNLYTVIFMDYDMEVEREEVLYGATIPSAIIDALGANYAVTYKDYKHNMVGQTVLPVWADIAGNIYDEETIIVADTTVYLGYALAGTYVSVDIDNSKLTFAHTYAPSIYFDKNTTVIDALKYFIHGNRNYNITAIKEIEGKIPQDIKDKVFSSQNVIDEDKNINFITKKVSIVELHATENEFKDKLVDEVKNLYPAEEIPDDIEDITHNFVDDLTTTGAVTVTPENKVVAEAAVEILERVTIEDVKEHIDENTLNIIGEEKLEELFGEHKDEYIQKLKDAIAAANGTPVIPPVVYSLRKAVTPVPASTEYHEVTTWITVAVDPIEDVLAPKYDQMRDKVEDLMADKNFENSTRDRIRFLMDLVSIENLFDYDDTLRGDTSNITEGVQIPTGYTIRAYESYYSLLEDSIETLEALALDLEDNYTMDEREDIVDKVINKICDEYLDKINEYVDKAAEKLLDYTDRVDATDKDITADQIREQRRRVLKLVLTEKDITLMDAFDKFLGTPSIEKTFKGQEVKLYWEYEVFIP